MQVCPWDHLNNWFFHQKCIQYKTIVLAGLTDKNQKDWGRVNIQTMKLISISEHMCTYSFSLLFSKKSAPKVCKIIFETLYIYVCVNGYRFFFQKSQQPNSSRSQSTPSSPTPFEFRLRLLKPTLGIRSSEAQYGFREGRSMEDAITRLYNFT